MTRSHLWVICDEKSQLFQVWEVVDKVPPSTARELEPPHSGEGPRPLQVPSRLQVELFDPATTVEVVGNGHLEVEEVEPFEA